MDEVARTVTKNTSELTAHSMEHVSLSKRDIELYQRICYLTDNEAEAPGFAPIDHLILQSLNEIPAESLSRSENCMSKEIFEDKKKFNVKIAECPKEEMKRSGQMHYNEPNNEISKKDIERKGYTKTCGEVIEKMVFELKEQVNKEQDIIHFQTKSDKELRNLYAAEMETIEKFSSLMLRALDNGCTHSSHREKELNNSEVLRSKFEELPKVLWQYEREVVKDALECNALEADIQYLQWEDDGQYGKKFHLKECKGKAAQEQLVSERASGYSLKHLNEANGKCRQILLNLAHDQRHLADVLLDVAGFKSEIFKRSDGNNWLVGKLKSVEISGKIFRLKLAILDSQIATKILKLTRRIVKLQHCGIKRRKSFLQHKIKLTRKFLSAGKQQLYEYQQSWQTLQNHCAYLSENCNQHGNNLKIMQQQLFIISQKSEKIHTDLAMQSDCAKELKRDITAFINKLEMLNRKMCKAGKQHSNDEKEYELEQAQLWDKLGVNGKHELNLKMEIGKLQDEMKECKGILQDKNRELLSLEVKCKLFEETLRRRKQQQNVNGIEKGEMHRIMSELQINLIKGLKKAQPNITLKKAKIVLAERKLGCMHTKFNCLENEIEHQEALVVEIHQELYNGELAKQLNRMQEQVKLDNDLINLRNTY